jgi:hypothetical protein
VNTQTRHLFAFLLLAFTFLEMCTGAYAAAIPADIKKTVTFIFLADKEGKLRVDPKTQQPLAIGTGFFVVVENESTPKRFTYLVTAKHVLQDPIGGIYTRIFIRLNRNGGGSDFVPIDLLKQQVFTSGDPSVDMSVIPLPLNPAIADVKAIPDSLIATRESFDKLHIAEGSDVFFVGLFTSYYGDKRNNPVVRFGKVAMLPEERISFGSADKSWLYLIEAQTFGGNSGAPVFFSLGVDREPNELHLGPPQIMLAGIMKGFFNQNRAIEFHTVETVSQTIPVSVLNSGIAAITPAYILHEILFLPDVVQQRTSALNK